MTYLPGRNPPLFAILPPHWDDGWREGKAGGSPAVMLAGDSWMMGHNGSDIDTTSFRGLLKAALVAKYGLGGEFFHANRNAIASATYNGTPPWVLNATGAPALYPYYFSGQVNYSGFAGNVSPRAALAGMGGDPLWLEVAIQTAATDTTTLATFTTPYAATEYDIVYPNGFAFSPAFRYAVDGGANNAVNVATADSTVQLAQTGLSSLASSAHVITIKASGNRFLLSGISAFPTGRSAAGLRWAPLAVDSAAWIGDGDISFFQKSLGAQRPSGTWGGAGFPQNPHLFIIETGLADSGFYPPQTHADRLTMAIRALRRAAKESGRAAPTSILIIVAYRHDGVISDGSPQANDWLSDGWHPYIRAMEAVAQSECCALFNVHARWQDRGVGSSYLPSADLHPVDAGWTDIYNFISPVVLA
jgi:hypothetical protein